MNFGTAWSHYLGECTKETAFSMLDYFYASGGNFIDTANNYQDEQSKRWIGEWMEGKGNRDQMVVATKFTNDFLMQKRGEGELQSNFGGNSAKSLVLTVEASLKKLRTSYIDVLYVHWWDQTTSIEELMQSLNRLVQNGKVFYLGISDTPAWIVSKANQYARDHGLRQFCLYQGIWNAAERDFERDNLPMCEDEGMSMAPWGVLGRGKFKSDEQRKEGSGRDVGEVSENDVRVSRVLEGIAERKGSLITSVALAYVMHASPYRVFPIIGGRKVEHIKGNIEALNLKLSAEEMREIEEATGFSYGFPIGFLTGSMHASTRTTASHYFITKATGHLDVAPKLTSLKEAGM